MNIGIAVEGTSTKGIEELCEHIQVIGYNQKVEYVLYEIIKDNINNDLYIERLPDLGLTFIELAEVFELLKIHKKMIVFLDKGPLYYLSDQRYFSMVNEIVENEAQVGRYQRDQE